MLFDQEIRSSFFPKPEIMILTLLIESIKAKLTSTEISINTEYGKFFVMLLG